MSDLIDRSELALVLDKAVAVEGDGDERLSLHEAERIAGEVGIPAEEFRRALAAVRSARLGKGRLLGPPASLSTHSRSSARARGEEIVRAMAQGQAVLPQFQAEIEEVVDGVWRSSTRGTLVQVSSGRNGTEVVVSASRPFTKASLLVGSTAVGGFIGGQLGALISMGLGGDPSSAVGLAIAAGGVGGLVAGFSAGAAMWRSTARALQDRMIQAAARIRGELGV